ncbi:DnaA ATPase domain-containing protein [Pedosphaera parvula]|uniref:DNA replication protein-like protein n=1 Tax=Pedosphaera parvula (strain Ellin514) TaxID=320771 RepID=B9XA29_PEDPL|nr:DnaA/Hda family protein [Pedosphaera parvula]EEF63370.1 DNA replication protein-like protein [Pedosphaera parvula Ellin514]
MPTFTCRYCKKDYPFEAPELDIELPPMFKSPTVCNSCADMLDRKRQESIIQERLEKWRSTCPVIYEDTDPNHIGMPAPPKLNQILQWKYGPKGLLVFGDTRKGKTRAVWLLIKRLMVDEGRKVEGMTCGEFARRCAKAYQTDVAYDWIDHLIAVDVLFIDDLGKSKMTERVVADLFEIFEQRICRKLPTIFTTNFVGSTLAEKMSHHGDAATYQHEPFIARLREFCELVSFG